MTTKQFIEYRLASIRQELEAKEIDFIRRDFKERLLKEKAELEERLAISLQRGR